MTFEQVSAFLDELSVLVEAKNVMGWSRNSWRLCPILAESGNHFAGSHRSSRPGADPSTGARESDLHAGIRRLNAVSSSSNVKRDGRGSASPASLSFLRLTTRTPSFTYACGVRESCPTSVPGSEVLRYIFNAIDWTLGTRQIQRLDRGHLRLPENAARNKRRRTWCHCSDRRSKCGIFRAPYPR